MMLHHSNMNSSQIISLRILNHLKVYLKVGIEPVEVRGPVIYCKLLAILSLSYTSNRSRNGCVQLNWYVFITILIFWILNIQYYNILYYFFPAPAISLLNLASKSAFFSWSFVNSFIIMSPWGFGVGAFF